MLPNFLRFLTTIGSRALFAEHWIRLAFNEAIDALSGLDRILYCDPDCQSGIPAPRRLTSGGGGGSAVGSPLSTLALRTDRATLPRKADLRLCPESLLGKYVTLDTIAINHCVRLA